MLAPYLAFNGNCEEAFNFYAEAFGGAQTRFARLNDDPSNPIMHASVAFTKHEGCVTGADVDEPVVISGMAICVVLPSREVIEEIAARLAAGGKILQEYMPHPPPDQDDGGMSVLDKYGYTWHFST